MDPPARTYLLELLLDLANDASTYLRVHAESAVRVSAALLVAASLAACSGLPGRPATNQGTTPAVQPLSQEVRSGLPSQPGRYPIATGSLNRDGQGVYHFTWLADGTRNNASVSRLRLAQSNNDVLEIPPAGDPILYLRSQTGVPLVPMGGGGGYYSFWHPFYGSTSGVPAYYDPPSRAVSPGADVNGSRVSSAPAASGDRTVGAPHTVSGRAGGTGSGQAASTKSGAGTSDGGSKGAGSAKSGGFSGGRGGGASGSSS